MPHATRSETYPAYSRAERIADGIMHAIGTTLAITGAVLLVVLVSGSHPAGTTAAVAVYAGALIATFVASACYHMTPWEAARPALRRLDHAAIYLKIAGTYTPLVALIGTAFGWIMLAIVWTLATIGAVAKLILPRSGRFSTLLYLGLGWLSLALMWPLAQRLPSGGTALIFAGGLLYSAGTLVLSREGLRYQNAIWHFFVLAASGCFFAAISWGVAASG